MKDLPLHFEDLCVLPGYTWRAMRLDDAVALHQFELACSQLDGATGLSSAAEWQHKLAGADRLAANSVIAMGEDGQVAAAGWIDYQIEAEEIQAFLDGRVHPQLRGQGIGGVLLKWLEGRARENMAPIAGGRRQVLRILFYDRARDAIQLYEQHGYAFQYSEQEMRRDLRQPLPDYPLPAGMSVQTWTADNASDFYSVYEDAFRTRTSSTWSESAWQHHFANREDEGFRPELSLIIKEGNEPLAYVVCHMDVVDEGEVPEGVWITQMAVRAAWRGRGIGAALLTETMRCFAQAGHTYAFLSVNVNNPQARRLYDRMGFEPTRRFTLYRKEI